LACIAWLSGCVAGPASLPEGLRASAEQAAARLGTAALARRQYFDMFRLGAIDALVWGQQIDGARRDSAKACTPGDDSQMHVIECAYADGIDAVRGHNAAITLADFGYKRTSVEGRIAARNDSQVRHVEISRERRWLLAPSPTADRLATGSCYRLDGYLAPDIPESARYPGLSGELIVLGAVASSCEPVAGN
jgi:hypothetical protein